MAKISDLKLAYQVFMKAYPYRRVDWRPGARLKKPLCDARVAVVTTAAFFRPDQPPFDTSIREETILIASSGAIPTWVHWASFTGATPSTSAGSRLTGIWLCRWIGCIPWRRGASSDRLRRVISGFMGSIAGPGRLIANTAPEVARMLLEDEVDAVLLTPV